MELTSGARAALGSAIRKQLFTLTSDALPAPARVLGFRGTEALSVPYEFDVALSIPSSDADLSLLRGARARLTIVRDGTVPDYVVHGVVDAVELFHEYKAHAVYVIRLTPALARLHYERHSRVFTDLSIPDVVRQVLTEAGFGGEDLEIDLARSYPPREHVCQYRETNLAFFQRLLEREGITFFFRHSDEREVLVLTDHRGAHVPLLEGALDRPISYTALNPGEVPTEEGFATFNARYATFEKTIVEKDYDYLRPSLEVKGVAALAGGTGSSVAFGETGKTTEVARQHASTLAERQRAAAERHFGWGRVHDLRTGYRFRLEGHSRTALNRSYVALRIVHTGNDSANDALVQERLDLKGDQTYLVSVEALCAELQFRPARVTPEPRIAGLVEGVVDGPIESPFAQIDEHGRYKVRLKFDESSLPDGKASMWIRMLQPHAGNPEGFHFPLRKQTEVQVMFVGGDPDRPVIVGAVPNLVTPSPVTSANASQNVIMTGGQNRFEAEDKAGGQYLFWRSPTHQSRMHLGAGPYGFEAYTEGNGLNYFGQNLDVQVLQDKTEEVTGSVTEVYRDRLSTTVHLGASEEYLDTYDRTVGAKATQIYDGMLDESVTGTTRQNYRADHEQAVAGAARIHQGSLQHTVVGAASYNHLATRTVVVAGSDSTSAGGDQTVHSATHQTLSGATQLIEARGCQEIKSGNQTMVVGGPQSFAVGSHQTRTAGPWVVYSGPMFEGWADGDFKLTAAGGNGLISAHASLNLQASAVLHATAPLIVMQGAGAVAIEAGGEVTITAGIVKIN